MQICTEKPFALGTVVDACLFLAGFVVSILRYFLPIKKCVMTHSFHSREVTSRKLHKYYVDDVAMQIFD